MASSRITPVDRNCRVVIVYDPALWLGSTLTLTPEFISSLSLLSSPAALFFPLPLRGAEGDPREAESRYISLDDVDELFKHRAPLVLLSSDLMA